MMALAACSPHMGGAVNGGVPGRPGSAGPGRITGGLSIRELSGATLCQEVMKEVLVTHLSIDTRIDFNLFYRNQYLRKEI